MCEKYRTLSYRLGKTACFASRPPCAFANRDKLKNLRQTKKAFCGNVGFHDVPSMSIFTKRIIGFQANLMSLAVLNRLFYYKEVYYGIVILDVIILKWLKKIA
jgi:hypothetical protein